MIVISSNRNVFPTKLRHNIFGNSFGGLGNRYAEVALEVPQPVDILDESEDDENDDDWWEVDLCDAGQEQLLFDRIVNGIEQGNEELKRPWVFFVHGNNQSFEKNLRKCQNIQEEHQVNVFAFSWPSMPRDMLEILIDVIKKETDSKTIMDVVRLGGDALKNITAGGFIGGLVSNKYVDYKEARSRAKSSANALMSALETFKNKIYEPVNGSIEVSLLIHSLGNHVAESLPLDELKNKFPEKIFSNIIFHQADVQASRYRSWLPDLSGLLAERAYITTNEHDNILLVSMLANRRRRLGQATYVQDQDNIKYIDFTNGIGVDSAHNFFSMNGGANPAVRDLFNKLLNSQTDNLDGGSGDYEKMQTAEPNVHRYRIADRYSEDVWGDNWEEDYE